MEAFTVAESLQQITSPPLFASPDPPVKVCVEQVTFSRVLLTWNPPVDQGFNLLTAKELAIVSSNGTGVTYTVQMAEGIEPFQTVYRGPLTQYTCSRHEKGTSYVFRVQSHNSVGLSSVWSEDVYIVTADNSRITARELHRSIVYNHMVWAEHIILTHSYLVNSIRHGRTALSLACSLGRSTLIGLLYLCGAIIDLRIANGKTSLMDACMYGHTRCAEMVLRLGARWDMESISGLTPLHLAVLGGQLDTAKFLLSFGVPVDIVGKSDPLQRTPLHCCGIHVLNHSVVRLLIDHNANVNRGDADGNTPLLLAIQHSDCTEKNILVVKELLSGNADPHQRNYKTGMHPLVLALYTKKTKVVELLKKYMNDETTQWNEKENGDNNECEDYVY